MSIKIGWWLDSKSGPLVCESTARSQTLNWVPGNMATWVSDDRQYLPTNHASLKTPTLVLRNRSPRANVLNKCKCRMPMQCWKIPSDWLKILTLLECFISACCSNANPKFVYDNDSGGHEWNVINLWYCRDVISLWYCRNVISLWYCRNVIREHLLGADSLLRRAPSKSQPGNKLMPPRNSHDHWQFGQCN